MRQRLVEALLAERLEQIVERMEIKRLDRILVERRGEDVARLAPASSATSKPSSLGIWISRNTRSGDSSVIAFTASKPLAHSATISTSACSDRYSRTTPRASISSSTMMIRIL
jgi:hypothetical protein